MIIAENIQLRPLKKSDKDLFFAWRNDLTFIEMALSMRLPKHELLEETWIENAMVDISNRHVYFIIEAIESGEAIGFTALTNVDWISRNAAAGIAIMHPEYRGKGLSTESFLTLFDYGFNKLNLHKIWTHVYSVNQASVKLHERLGCTLEGTLKEHYYWNNAYHDALQYGITKDHFNKING
ncbi:MAG: spermidine N1-acetyltransferase [Crocinitomicaceae bacterium]